MVWKPQRILLLFIDIVLLCASWLLTYQLRWFETGIPDSESVTGDNFLLQIRLLLIPIVATHVALYWGFALYKGMLRYASIRELRAIAAASAVHLGFWIIINWFFSTQESFFDLPQRQYADGTIELMRIPWGNLAFYFLLSMFSTGGLRMARRMWLESAPKSNAAEAPRTLIVGAGDTADSVLRNFARTDSADMRPVCCVAENAERVGLRIHGVPIEGTIDKIQDVVKDKQITKVLIALDRPSPELLRRVVSHCETAGVTFLTVPTLADIADGRVEVSQTREVQVEDLLGREPVRLALPEERNYLAGRTVLITGAGGSIGSELARQGAASSAARLLLLGKGENSIFFITTEILRRFADVEAVPIIADIRDAARLEQVFTKYKPDIVFHAAAHKHVPLMEDAPEEAVKNNILGTWNVMKAAEQHGAKRFVLISSDKAVAPSSVMGATKRFTEMLLKALSRTSRCCYQAVRFGNVMGSRGSVIPLFQEQIRHGGPVTVTHPDVTRFFMTIPEAVSLVLQAGSRDVNGATYVLDMGRPVRIVDLARNLIALSGLRPDVDIKIAYTGLRPGEKLEEHILTDFEQAEKTEIEKVMLASSDEHWELEELEQVMAIFAKVAASPKENELHRLLVQIVPDYHVPGLLLSSEEKLEQLEHLAAESPQEPVPVFEELEQVAEEIRSEQATERRTEYSQAVALSEPEVVAPRNDLPVAEGTGYLEPEPAPVPDPEPEWIPGEEPPHDEPLAGENSEVVAEALAALGLAPVKRGGSATPDIELAHPPQEVEEVREREEELAESAGDRLVEEVMEPEKSEENPSTPDLFAAETSSGSETGIGPPAAAAPVSEAPAHQAELFQYTSSEETMTASDKTGKAGACCLLLRVAKGSDQETIRLLVQQIQENVLAQGEHLVVSGPGELVAGLPVKSIVSGSAPEGSITNQALESCPGVSYLITFTSDVLLTRETVDAFLKALGQKGVVLAYSNYHEDRDGAVSDVKLHDHEGCPHERFEFGPVIGYCLQNVKKVGGIRGDLNFAWEYDIHLKLMEIGKFERIKEFSYTRFIPVVVDQKGKKVFSPGMGPLGGFSYVFYPADVEKEVTSVFEEAMKRRGTWIDQPFKNVDYKGKKYDVLATVVVPILNRRKFIGNAIEKVQSGTYPNFEMIIVDNGSTDGTIDVVKKYAEADKRIRLLHGTGGSIASAINEGIRAARGKYICQLDSDDEYAPDTLEQMVNHLESHPQCGLAISYYRLMDENGKIIEDIAPVTHSGYSRNQILRRDGAGALRVFPKVVLEEFGYYDEEHYGNFGEDYDMVLKTGEWYSVDRVHKVLYHYRRHSDNTDVTRDPEMKYKNKNRARQEALRRRRKINEDLGKV